MRLKAVRLENFRSYRERVVFDKIPELSILIGRNNAGKSNFIRALDWYRQMERQVGMSTRRLQHTGNLDNPLTFEVEFDLDPVERESILSGLPFDKNISAEMSSSNLLKSLKHYMRFEPTGTLVEETISISNFSGDWLAVWGNTRLNNTNQENTVFWQHDISTAASTFKMAKNFDTVYPNGGSYSHKDRAFAWEPMSLPLSHLAVLFRGYLQRILWIPPQRHAAAQINLRQDVKVNPTGENVLRVLNTTQSEDADLYDAILLEIYDIIPDIKRIRTPPRGSNVVGIIDEPGNVQIELDDAGTGFEQTLILVVNLLIQPQNSLLLVEEPEMNLNAGAQRALFRLIKRIVYQRHHQMIITTHSTIFTETSEQVATYLLDKKEGISSCRRLNEPAELRRLKQELGHENTDLFGYNAVLIVEGDTEEKCLPLLASVLGLDLVRLGIRIISIGGAGAAVRIDKLLEYVRDSDTVPFVMLDAHSPAIKSKDKWTADKIVKAENIFLLPKEFEDCFDDQVLAAALAAVASMHGSSLSITDTAIASYRASGKAVSSFLDQAYFEGTRHSLSKPELGLAIGELLAKNSQRSTLTEPERVLKAIQERLGLRQ